MTCRDVIEFLMDYESGALGERERTIFESHLKICPPCVSFLQNYRQTIEFAQAARGDDVPADCPDAAGQAQVPEQLIQAILAARGEGK